MCVCVCACVYFHQKTVFIKGWKATALVMFLQPCGLLPTAKQLVPNLTACWLTLKSSTTMSDPPEAYSHYPEISVVARGHSWSRGTEKDSHFLSISLLRDEHPLQSSRAGVGLGIGTEKELSWHSQSRLHFSALGEKRQHSSWLCSHHLVSKSHKHDFWLLIPLYNKAVHNGGTVERESYLAW